MNNNPLLFLPFLLMLFSCTAQKNNAVQAEKHQVKAGIDTYSFETVQTTYDTLIPIFEGLFVTYHQIDSAYYAQITENTEWNISERLFEGEMLTPETKKWGVIDSLGNVIVPFICDGAKQIADNKGIISVFLDSYSLNTGIPRYQYIGTYYYFTKEGILSDTKTEFSVQIQFISDFHSAEFVLRYGPEFYLPDEYRNLKY
jgi:hypothetical protein